MATTCADTPSCAAGPAAGDAGFTLVEVIVATVSICIVMAALTAFFANTVRITHLSSGQSAAAELATEGIELARATPVADLRTAAAYPGGRWIPPGRPGNADPEQPVRNNVRFARGWSITPCWQPPGGGSCGNQAVGYLPFLRITVTVSWPDGRCAQGQCSFVTSTLLSNALRDPVFTS